jgi:transposase
LADVVGMTDGTVMTAEVAANSYEARKSSLRAGRDPGVEVRVRPVRRRTWSTEDRLRIVRETLEPGAVAKAIADRYGISTGLLYTWRKQMLSTAMTGFVPVQLVSEAPELSAAVPSSDPVATAAVGSIEILLPCGTSLRIAGAADAATLRVVLAELGGR